MFRFVPLLLLVTPVALAVEPAPMPRAAGPIPFAAVVAAALADARTLPADVAAQTRYLEARHLPEADRRELLAVTGYHVNGLSRESRRTPPRVVTPWLWAVRIDDYRWRAETWENLAAKNVYYAQQAVVTVPGVVVTKSKQVLRANQYGQQYYATESYTETGPATTRKEVITAPWLPLAETAALVSLTGSRTPIVRADQFLFLSGAQIDRAGHGYYDWLALTSRADAEKLAALDRAKAIERYRERAAIIPVSGVSPQNRQVFQFDTVGGTWWETRDCKTSTAQQNAVRNLLDDFKHDAEEIVFDLPNGLPGYYLSDAAGKQVDTAPDFIAADHGATNNDRRVHPGYSCVACHTESGLKPLRNYVRNVYNPETGLALGVLQVDPVRARRIESAYTGPLEKAYRRDVANFAEAVEDASGLKGADLARAYQRQWSLYLDAPVTLARVAAEAGYTPAELRDRLRAHARVKGLTDPVLAVYLTDDPPPVRREHVEEGFGLLMLTLLGAAP